MRMLVGDRAGGLGGGELEPVVYKALLAEEEERPESEESYEDFFLTFFS